MGDLYNAATRATAANRRPTPLLLLANKWDESIDPTGMWMSEKLDGVRCFWDGKAFVSRNGIVFPAPGFFLCGLPDAMTLDGELWGGRGQFQSTVSVVKTANSERWRGVVFQVFDVPSLKDKPFEERMDALAAWCKDHPYPHIRMVKQERCKGREHLCEQLRKIETLGGEGLMLRRPGSVYVGSRSSTLLKVKTFHDADARVIGYEAGKGKYKGMTGALQCQMACGKRFTCGSGMRDHDRQHPPPIGSIITYRFQELTEDGVPRFPVFVGVRIDATEPSDPASKKTRGE
jgi:DNA ligase-1